MLIKAQVAQFGTWLGNQRVVGSSLTRTTIYTDCVLVAGEVSPHLLNTADVPSSK